MVSCFDGALQGRIGVTAGGRGEEVANNSRAGFNVKTVVQYKGKVVSQDSQFLANVEALGDELDEAKLDDDVCKGALLVSERIGGQERIQRWSARCASSAHLRSG